MSGPAKVHPLHGNQMHAVAPEETVWLSASAGTGKTQVLSSRVLRLLLQPRVEPSQILCLTFTKAGATEMAARINGTLAEWVRLPDPALFQRLEAIGAPSDDETRARARTLFAAVLDCPGGGLRIDTIHAFAQWLLGAFPHEAGLVPGTRPMEDRDRVLLARQVLAELLTAAEREPLGDPQMLAAVADLSLRMGPEDVEAYLLRCAEAREAWFGAGAWQEPMRPRINQVLGLPADADADFLAAICADDAFDVRALRRCLDVNREWKAKTGQENAAKIEAWLAGVPEQRAAGLDALFGVFFTKEGKLRATTSLDKLDPGYAGYVADVGECISAARAMASLLALADRLVPALRLGRAFALAWDEAKKREGLIDFDDQIRQAASLLATSDLAEWIRYKLDRRFDHILVDEAQDTNAAQWRIIDALTGDFFAGLGQHDEKLRTLFVVGDYKQAIFRFQGTSPENFEQARQRVKQAMRGAVDAAQDMRLAEHERPRPLREYGLDRSFRTAQPVLDFVDAALEGIGHEEIGLREAPEVHQGEARPGYVALWRPVGLVTEDDPFAPEEEEPVEENWFSRADRKLAEQIAQQVRRWMHHGFPLVKGGARRAGPGDVMILVRRRRELAGLIVARLHAAGVPVAGVDRLRLGAPLAVRDLVAALRFAAQPFDDLNLASLLVSPLLGWTQEDLLAHGYRDKGVRLWSHLRQIGHPVVDTLNELLRLADYDPPQALLHWLLVGPWQGRRKLIARLGREANDPIDELLNAASAYTASATPSLVGFLAWFDAGEGELKREASGAGDLVRVMTVHGSKGLQAPIVILADAAGNPASRGGRLDLPDLHAPERKIPLPGLRKEDRVGRIAEHHAAIEREEMQEHWRLLYVAMTRAEEALFIGSALSAREKVPAENSWYAKLALLFGPEDEVADPLWTARFEWGALGELPPAAPGTRSVELPLPEPLPVWLERGAPAEPRPPKPLAPSALGEDQSPDPPWPPGAGSEAARRGVLVHKLLERLPEVPEAARGEAGARWLARNAEELDPAQRDDLLAAALAVLAHPDWRALFVPEGLAEVPIAAVVGGQVVSGKIDRLLIEPTRVRLVDFKTARRPPLDASEVPVATLRQMAAYAAALEVAYPGRAVEAALLYTAAPRLIVLPADVLAEHKRVLLAAE
ncbi:MAG: double-strand break repair helicase AddA [Novosphingobium sp.]|nr:MAG: double-strand break repair helicase AddA [Novosphingobium sp.]